MANHMYLEVKDEINGSQSLNLLLSLPLSQLIGH
jgi:hypothetical protein